MSRRSSFLLPCLLLLAAANSAAMSLGRLRGAALVGRPLDMSIQAVMDAKDDIASLCIDAEVFYADTKIDKSRVRVTAEKVVAGSQDVVIRVRASTLVDEPVVTVYLRAGCQQKTERRYVALADLASDVSPDRNSAAIGAQQLQQLQTLPPTGAGQSPTELGEAAPPTAQRTPRAARDRSLPRSSAQLTDKPAPSRPRPVAAAGQAPPAPATASSPRKPAKPAASQATKTATNPASDPAALKAQAQLNAPDRARLKLESLDLSSERNPQLKPSSELLSAPATNLQERAAAAALWRAINTQPQDMMREFDKLQTLEGSVRTLQAQDQKARQTINELDTQLKKASSERYANLLVYALGFLLLLALAALAYLLRTRSAVARSDGVDAPWWRRTDNRDNHGGDPRGDSRAAWAGAANQADTKTAGRSGAAKKGLPSVFRKTKRIVPEVDLTSPTVGVAKADSSAATGADSLLPDDSKYNSEFALGLALPSRAVKAEELFDVQQQADFFVSIGQQDQAIDVLRAHISDNRDTSALVYLDLFELYHQVERKEDYALLRGDFNRQFNTEVPVFELYTDAGPGLEAYPAAIARIVALWRSAKILDLLEESIFRHPETKADAFNLEAYRELLMLYSIAKEVSGIQTKEAASPERFGLTGSSADELLRQPAVFLPTEILPLSASVEASLQSRTVRLPEPLLEFTVPPSSISLGLDFDLSDLEPANGELALPVIDLSAPTPTASVTTLNVADAEFFAQFDKLSAGLPMAGVAGGAGVVDMTGGVRGVTGAQASAKKSATVAGNLMDFDAFSADTSPRDVQPSKPPKT